MTTICTAVKILHSHTKAIDISIVVSPAEERAWQHITVRVDEGD